MGSSGVTRRLPIAALLVIGAADLAWIELQLLPKVLAGTAAPQAAAVQPAPVVEVLAARAPEPEVAIQVAPPATQVADPEPELPGSWRVHFRSNRAELGAAASAVLDEVAARLSSDPEAKVELEGHADRRGPSPYNAALSKRRAEAVASALVARGAPEDRLVVVAYGEQRPVEHGATSKAWAQNRRVEIRLKRGER